MAKFYGLIGYGDAVETRPGVYEETIIERNYYGDILRNIRRIDNSQKINDDISISNQISIIADQYAYNNFHAMKYVEFMDAVWRITDVEVQHPRLILTLGGVYNG